MKRLHALHISLREIEPCGLDAQSPWFRPLLDQGLFASEAWHPRDGLDSTKPPGKCGGACKDIKTYSRTAGLGFSQRQ